jgi:hypothetical protein
MSGPEGLSQGFAIGSDRMPKIWLPKVGQQQQVQNVMLALRSDGLMRSGWSLISGPAVDYRNSLSPVPQNKRFFCTLYASKLRKLA